MTKRRVRRDRKEFVMPRGGTPSSKGAKNIRSGKTGRNSKPGVKKGAAKAKIRKRP